MTIQFVGCLMLFAALSGCAGTEGVYRVENATGQPIPGHALADEIFLDGTGPSARMLARSPSAPAGERRDARRQQALGSPLVVSPAVTVGARTTAIEAASTAPATTGSTAAATRDARSFHEWVEDEKRQDARMRTIMNICQGC